jgi:putative NADH-flavin reductase
MRIAVLGATGPSGIQVVKEALQRGHEVRAIVRNPDKLVEKHDKLQVNKPLKVMIKRSQFRTPLIYRYRYEGII